MEEPMMSRAAGTVTLPSKQEGRADDTRRNPPRHHNQNRCVRSNHGRTIKRTPVKTHLPFAARNEQGAEHENQQRAGEIQDTGIKHRTGPEDGRHDRITDEPHIAESQHEAIDAPLGRADRQDMRKQKSSAYQDHISGKSHDQQRQNEVLVRKRVAHYRRKYQAGARHIDNQFRKFAVEFRIHHFLLAQTIAEDDQHKQDNHLRYDCIHHSFSLKTRQR